MLSTVIHEEGGQTGPLSSRESGKLLVAGNGGIAGRFKTGGLLQCALTQNTQAKVFPRCSATFGRGIIFPGIDEIPVFQSLERNVYGAEVYSLSAELDNFVVNYQNG